MSIYYSWGWNVMDYCRSNGMEAERLFGEKIIEYDLGSFYFMTNTAEGKLLSL
jgi:hypothetical protein